LTFSIIWPIFLNIIKERIKKMIRDWQTLTRMTGGKEIVIERVGLKEDDLKIEGSFELPPMAKLSMEDQIFAAAFVKSHGSIKEMERLYGISYPTVKNRLNKIAEQFDFINIDVNVEKPRTDVLERLDRGEISIDQALEELK